MKLEDSQKKYKAPPRTAMEVFEMLPDGTLAEVINKIEGNKLIELTQDL